jgi:hypothetical protein
LDPEFGRDLHLWPAAAVQQGAYSDEAGRGFRFEAGRRSEAKPATIPI